MTATTPSTAHRVVVTGLGAITPIGLSADAFWEGLVEGRSGAAHVERFDPSPFETTFACELKDYDPEAYLDRKQARRLDRYAQYALIAAAECLRNAGFDPADVSDEARERMGVVFGSGIGGLELFQEQVVTYHEEGPRRISPFFVPMMITNQAAGLVATDHGFRGPNHCVVSACATGNHAICDSVLLLRHGHADAMICGGAEACVTELGLGGFNAMRALSTRNDSPETASRPFDKDRDGFVMGDGAGALFLETLEHARARDAEILAEVVGIGMSDDAYHYAAPDPDGRGARLAMENALKDAELNPEDVDHINMHATSTPAGDPVESQAIEQTFGDHAYDISCSATKSMTGHLLGAAGAIEAVAAIRAIRDGVAPPTINTETPDEGCNLDYTLDGPRERRIDVAISNAFGFGGHNTTVAFKKFED